MVRIATLTGLLLLALLMAASGVWATLALAIAGPHVAWMRIGPAVLAGMATVAFLAALMIPRWRWKAVAAWLLFMGGVLVWWNSLTPSNDRDWLPNVARTPWATVSGDTVTIHNIRNFTYRTETDFTPAWYDKSYDLRKLEGIDIVTSYWMGPDIAHVFVSFAFAGGEHLAMSIETRTEKGEGYSAIKGFFRQYELTIPASTQARESHSLAAASPLKTPGASRRRRRRRTPQPELLRGSCRGRTRS